jgi:6-pyruvoyltetrahydropterin/6-carboxytetrahydropterin synthase
MYATTVSTDFVAQHHLTVPDPGPEGRPHSHHYAVDVTFRGPRLDEYDYLVDIDDAEAALAAVADDYRDRLLNDMAAFEGANPSVERFARVVHDRIADAITAETVTEIEVTVWEDEAAAASYRAEV